MLPGRNYTPEDIVRVAWGHKWLIAGGLVIFTAAATMMSMRLPDLYKSETLILIIPQRIPESFVRSTITMRIEDRLRSISQQILSRSRLERVIDDFGLYPDERKTQPIEQIVEQMRQDIAVETVKDDAFKVSFTSYTPRTAMIVTDRLASMFLDENLRDREVMAEGTNKFLETQLEDARRRLVDNEKKLEDYRRRYAGELPSQLQTNFQVIQGTQNQIQNLTESINRDRDRRLILEKSIADGVASDGPAGSVSEAVASSDPTAIGQGRAIDQLDRARNELRGMELRLKAGHPDVVAKKRVIAELERKVQLETAGSEQASRPSDRPVSTAELIREGRVRQYRTEMAEIDRQIAAKEADVDRLERVIADYQRRVDAVPGRESELTALMRDYDTIQKVYSSLLAKKEDSKISVNLERQQVGEQFKILDPARLPEKPFSPNRLRIVLIGALLGLGFGVGLAGFLEYRDTSLRTEDEIVRTLVLPVIAAIPIMVAVADRQRHRRNVIASTAAAVLMVVGVAAAAMWSLGF